MIFTQNSYGLEYILIDKNTKYISSKNHIYYINDKQNKLDAYKVLNLKDIKKASRLHIGVKEGSFWTRVSIKNISDITKTIFIYNPLAGINMVDVHIFKNNTLVKTLQLGDLRDQKDRELLSRYGASFTYTLQKDETITIVSKINNYYIYNIGWDIKSVESFIKDHSNNVFALAFYGGVMIIFSILTFFLYRLYKDVGYLIVSINAIVLILYFYGFNGILYYLDMGVSLALINTITWNMALVAFVLFTIFPYYFFNLKQRFPKFTLLIKFLVLLTLIIIFISIYAQYIDEKYFAIFKYVQYLTFLIPTSLIILGIYMAIKKEAGSKYYLIAQGILFVAINFNALALFGFINYHESYKSIIPIANMFDLFFLLLAQYKQTKIRQNELIRNKDILIEQARFISIGQAIGNITHQWKKPLTGFGSNITYLETILKNDESNLHESFNKKLPNLKFNISLMQKTLDDLSNYFSTKNISESFDPKYAIEKYVLELLNSKITLKNVAIKIDTDDKFEIECKKYIFSNLMMILIDNSLDAFKDNKGNKISINIYKKDKKYIIHYTDNAGGIKVKPIEKIFEYFYSDKQDDSLGHGMGMPIAKMLIEDRLNGSITLKNINDGVEFIIEI